MEDITQPQTISYKLQECLGQGLNSCVYKALREDRGLHISQPVAIKILNSENHVDIWKKEFLSLSKVRSKHCVAVLGFDWIERQPALILELVEGLNLADLTRHVELDEDQVGEIAAQIRQGLEDLSQEGLSHGDLSLNNIMINEQGCVQLLDFGMANFSEVQTQTTVEFASPAVLAGEKPDLQTDLYSLSLIVKKLLGTLNSQNIEKRLQQKSSAQIQTRLADCVKQARLRRLQSPQTMAFSRPRPSHQNARFLRRFVIFLILTWGLTLRGETAVEARPSYLTIRSDRWIVVKINGQNQGYAPFEAKAVAAGVVEIDYQHSRGAGHRTLTIRKGQHIVLENSFFGL